MTRVILLSLILVSCSRNDPAAPVSVDAVDLDPDPLPAGLTVATLTAMVENHGSNEVVIIGASARVSRSGRGAVTARPREDNPQGIESKSSQALRFRLGFDPALEVGEELTAFVELAVRNAGADQGWVVRSDSETWTAVDAATLADADGDGLTDEEEAAIGTSVANPDSDGDGISDAEEVGPNPESPRDSDGDQVIDALDVDSDNGGEGDRSEAFAGRDPTDPADDVVGAALVVTTVDDERDGPTTMTDVAEAGGAGDLSLREAIHIANNRPGPDQITFDPAVFPQASPATIQVDGAGAALGSLPRITDVGTVIDGVGAGVVLNGGGDARDLEFGLDVEAEDVHLFSLGVENFNRDSGRHRCVNFYYADRFVIDDVDVHCDGGSGDGVRIVRSNEGIVRDSAIFGEEGLYLSYSGGVRIEGNDLGAEYHSLEMDTVSQVLLDGNNIRGGEKAGVTIVYSAGVTLINNTIQNAGHEGVGVYHSDDVVIRNNIIQYNVEDGVWTDESDSVEITENSITGNGGRGITRTDPNPPRPTITGFDEGIVTGTITGFSDGSRVEVFVDLANEGEELVGTGTVTANAFAVSVTIPATPPGNNLTVTVTEPGIEDVAGSTSRFSPPFAF